MISLRSAVRVSMLFFGRVLPLFSRFSYTPSSLLLIPEAITSVSHSKLKP